MSRRCSASGRWGASVCAAVLLMPALRAQEQAHAAAAAELAAKANRGELTVALALEALGSAREDDARIVASILRNEWQALPDELFDGLDLDARAARRFLEELALAPRPAALRWVRSQALAHRDRSYDHRMFAFAARGEALTRDEAAVLVESLRRERPSDGFYHACAQLTPKLVGGARRMCIGTPPTGEALHQALVLRVGSLAGSRHRHQARRKCQAACVQGLGVRSGRIRQRQLTSSGCWPLERSLAW